MLIFVCFLYWFPSRWFSEPKRNITKNAYISVCQQKLDANFFMQCYSQSTQPISFAQLTTNWQNSTDQSALDVYKKFRQLQDKICRMTKIRDFFVLYFSIILISILFPWKLFRKWSIQTFLCNEMHLLLNKFLQTTNNWLSIFNWSTSTQYASKKPIICKIWIAD